MGEPWIHARCRYCLSRITFPKDSCPDICPSCHRDDWIDGKVIRRVPAPDESESTNARVLELSATGMSAVDIARELEVSFSSVMSVTGRGQRRW